MEGAADEVVCEGVAGPNLVADAVAALRAAGWDAPPVRIGIHKRIPVAAGMGGGSADAAAMLRLAPRLAPVAGERVAQIAAGSAPTCRASSIPGPVSARARERSSSRFLARLCTACSYCRSRFRCRPPTSTARPIGSAWPGRARELTSLRSPRAGVGAALRS